MAKRDILLRLSKAQAEALKFAATITLEAENSFENCDPKVNAERHLRIDNMKLTKVLARHAEKEKPNA